MDLNLENCISPAIAITSITSNSICNSDDTVLRLESQAQAYSQKKQDHLFCSVNRSSSVSGNASFPKEMQRKCFAFHEARSICTCFDDDCGLVLGLGSSKCSSLPKTTSTASSLCFGTTSGGNFETMQLKSNLIGKPRSGQQLHDGATSGISDQYFHNTIQGHQLVASNKVSSAFTQTDISENKMDIESIKCSSAMVTKSLDLDTSILQLGLSRASLDFGKQMVMNPFSVIPESDSVLVLGQREEGPANRNTVLLLGQRQEDPANGIETHRSMHIHVDEGSTSGRLESMRYMPSLLTGPRMENMGPDSLPQIGTSSFIINHPLQKSLETIRTSCSAITSNGFPGTEEHRNTTKTCKFTGCHKGARGSSGLCISHGGGNRCQKSGCTKGAESRTVYCKAHGGGRRCQHLGCTKSAEGKTDYCIGHGGGRRCNHEGCSKAARGRSGLCIRHGGGKRCQKEGCLKSAECYSSLCISHGGGRRCQYPECTKGAQGSTMYCKAHGGGKRCIYTGCNKGAEGSTLLCKGHGGGKRCMFDGGSICPKSVHGGTQFCVAHGGGKRCAVEGCTKSARGRTDFCVKHGGGKRCTFEGCGKSAQGSTDFCKAHGGGKRCLWGREGSVYAREVHRGMNGPCDRFARGKIGLCAAHGALVEDHRSHGGKALGPGIGPGLFHGLACTSVSDANSNSIGDSAVSGEILPLVTRFEQKSLQGKASEASNCVVEQNINRGDNIELEPSSTKKDRRENELTPPEFHLGTNHLAKWNMRLLIETKMVEAPTPVEDMNIDTDDVSNEGPCRYQLAFPHPNLATSFARNFTPGGTEVGGSTLRKQRSCIGLPSDQVKNYYQLSGSAAPQPLTPQKIFAPFPMKKDLKTLQIEKHGYGSGSIEGGHFSLPEGRVHGGSLMSMLSRDLRPGHVGFVPFLDGALESEKQVKVQSNSGMFQYAPQI